jgi:hypothetical protein
MLSSTAHADLELRILGRMPPDPSGTSLYRIELTLDHAQEYSGLADLDDLAPWDAITNETKEEYGARLFDRLLPEGDLRDAWNRMSGQSPLRRIRLRIDPDLPALHMIQWELLRLPDGVPGADLAIRTATPFSRYLPQQSQPGTPILARPVRVLVAIANPDGLEKTFGVQPVDVAQEYTNLLTATAGITDDDNQPLVQFDLLEPPCTLDAIRDRLKQGYHVLHFVGHGLFRPADAGKPEQAALLMADPARNNTASLVKDVDIATMLANHLADTTVGDENRLRLVFLESCGTAKRDASDAFRGLAPRLVQAGVAAVVAMQDVIEVKTAGPFAATFYRQLLRHGLVDLACNEARAAVQALKLRGAEVPVLFMRLRSGELLRVQGELRGDLPEATFWSRLIANINKDTCIPFLGPRINRGILPGPETIAREVAASNGYRLADRDNLARVAQFEAFKDPDAFRATYLDILKQSLCRTFGRPASLDRKALSKASLTRLIAEIGWDTMIARVEELRIYDQLAALEMPLYITSSVDSLLIEAIKHRLGAHAGNARRIGPRWRNTEAGDPNHPPLDPAPAGATPYVFHLNGFDDEADPSQLEHIAFSEDDMMTAFVRLARDQDAIIPSNLLRLLGSSSWVFLGYNLQDWEFRLALQGLLQQIAQVDSKRKLHVGVQFESAASASGLTEEEVQAYLQTYLGQRFNITVYWGTPAQFVSQLHERLLNG